jgi:predicted phosphodiesterase
MLRIIGDIHGKQEAYSELAREVKHSVQVGDMGLNYTVLTDSVNAEHHRFVPGNHDNYDNLPAHAFKDDYSMTALCGIPFLYVRGAYSIDKTFRTLGISWWGNEEISWQSGLSLIQYASSYKPSLIISHDCPYCVYSYVLTNEDKWRQSRTAQILDALFKAHQPDVWVFGHHHKDIVFKYPNTKTTFVCLDELSYVDYPSLQIHRAVHFLTHLQE